MVVGRDLELAALVDALGDAASGNARRLLLIGDPGIGRSTLLRAVIDRARTMDFTVLSAACPEGSRDLRYGMVDDLAHCRPELLDELGPVDSALLDGLTVRPAPGPARVATALIRLLSAADRTGPVLVVVDDVHAADPDSMAALAFAAGRLVGRRVALVASATRHPVADPRLRDWEVIDVGPLGLEPAVTVLRAALPPHVRESLPDEHGLRLADLLGGNPTALKECPRVLSEDEICGNSPLPDPIPVGDRLLAGWRASFDALTSAQQDALLVALVTAGHGHPLREATFTLAGTSAADLAAGESAMGSRAQGPGSATGSGSGLIRQAVLACAGPARVGRVHGLAAVAADQLGMPPAIVVEHLQRSEGQVDRALPMLEEQSDRALAIGQVATAARALTAAALLAPEPDRRARLAARAARLRVGVPGADEDAGPLLEVLSASELSDEERVWEHWLRAQHTAIHDLRGSLGWMVRAAHTARRSDPEIVPGLVLAASFQAWAVGDGISALGLADLLLEHEADRSSRMRGPDLTPATPPWAGLALRGVARFQVGDAAAADCDLTTARGMSDSWVLTPEVPVPMLVNIVLLDEVMGTGRRLADHRLDLATQQAEGDSGEVLSILRNVQGARALRRGDLTLARALVDEGLDISRAMGSPNSTLLRLCTAVRLDALVGDREALARESAELRALAQGMRHESGPPYADRAEGLLALAELRYGDAASVLMALTEDLLLGMGPTDPVPMGRGDLVEALVGVGDLAGARTIRRDLVSLLGGSRDVRARALVARASALVEDTPESLSGLSSAVGLWRTANDSFELARTRLMLGETLLRAGHRTRAGVELRAAARSFDLMGAAPWASRAWAALDESGCGTDLGRPAPLDLQGSLTAAELRVARAIADGSTNKDVAQRLSLSPRTVEHHLASAYRKLGVRSRTGLVARMTANPPSAEDRR